MDKYTVAIENSKKQLGNNGMKQKEKLYSQNKIAEILGIGRGTFSKWLKENGVSPKQLEGQKKLYSETVIEQYKKSKRETDIAGSKRLTTVELLQSNLDEKQSEIDYLRKQLEDKERQLKEKDRLIVDKDEVIRDSNGKLFELGNKVAKLADQAQQLNLADKKQQKLEENVDHEEVTVADVDKTVRQGQIKKKGFFAKLFGKN